MTGLVVAFSRAAPAQYLAIAADFAVEIDSFAAGFTYDAFAFVSGKFFGRQCDFQCVVNRSSSEISP